MFEKIQAQPFHCSDCGDEPKEIGDPWYPRLVDSFSICSSICACGGKILPAKITFKRKGDNHAPDISIWKASLIIDFGKCHPGVVLWSGRLQSREFRADLENAFANPLVEFGAWH
jgi:hypothetical protein